MALSIVVLIMAPAPTVKKKGAECARSLYKKEKLLCRKRVTITDSAEVGVSVGCFDSGAYRVVPPKISGASGLKINFNEMADSAAGIL
jgi:hypothetical protein